MWIVVPAAGVGERMGGEMPKQYLELGDSCLLQTTLDQLLAVPDVEGIVVVLSAQDTQWSSLPASTHDRIHRAQGGDTRSDSVIGGLKYLSRRCDQNSWVMVHDAARPLIQVSDVQRLFNAVYNSGAVGGILGTPVQDTLKEADDYCSIARTVDRQGLWQAQTPQLFRLGQLLHALEEAREKNRMLTDEASAMEYQGHEPLLIEALQPNFKITRPVDLIIARAMLSRESVSS